MSRRLPPAALGALALALTLAACTAPAPAPDDARASKDETQHADGDRTDVVDPWEGHFTDRAAELDSASGVSWGSFGPDGAVSPAGWTAASLPPGDHVVTVECAGAQAFPLDVALSQAEELPDEADAQELSCPGGATYPFTTDSEGLSIGLDSHGEPGAYLIAIDVLP